MYIIMDLDDTLLNKKKEITPYSMGILKGLQKEGHIIVINTARSIDATKEVIEYLGADYSIMNAGALITKGVDIIYKNKVDSKTTNLILDKIKDYGISEFSIECEKGLLCNLKEYSDLNEKATFFDYNDIFPYEAYKILFKCDNHEFPKMLSDKYHLELTHYVGGPWFRLSMCTKHDGNIALYNILNDNHPQSICFGDDLGDIEMLENATVGVAMLNSVPKVLDKIKKVTQFSSDEDGVTRYLEKYFKEKNA